MGPYYAQATVISELHEYSSINQSTNKSIKTIYFQVDKPQRDRVK